MVSISLKNLPRAAGYAFLLESVSCFSDPTPGSDLEQVRGRPGQGGVQEVVSYIRL